MTTMMIRPADLLKKLRATFGLDLDQSRSLYDTRFRGVASRATEADPVRGDSDVAVDTANGIPSVCPCSRTTTASWHRQKPKTAGTCPEHSIRAIYADPKLHRFDLEAACADECTSMAIAQRSTYRQLRAAGQSTSFALFVASVLESWHDSAAHNRKVCASSSLYAPTTYHEVSSMQCGAYAL